MLLCVSELSVQNLYLYRIDSMALPFTIVNTEMTCRCFCYFKGPIHLYIKPSCGSSLFTSQSCSFIFMKLSTL